MLFSFSNLLLINQNPVMFIKKGGLDVLSNILKGPDTKIKNNYFGLLSYWILSYEEAFVSYAATPSVFLYNIVN